MQFKNVVFEVVFSCQIVQVELIEIRLPICNCSTSCINMVWSAWHLPPQCYIQEIDTNHLQVSLVW